MAWKLLDAYPAQMEAARRDGTLLPARATLRHAACQREVQVKRRHTDSNLFYRKQSLEAAKTVDTALLVFSGSHLGTQWELNSTRISMFLQFNQAPFVVVG